MSNKRESWLNHTGLNLIRIVIGSYFLAVSLGLISSFEFGTALAPVYAHLPQDILGLVGSGILLVLSVLFMSGILLRQSALSLAFVVLASGLTNTFMPTGPVEPSLLWRDLTLVCAILMCYGTLRRNELRKASVLRYHSTFGLRPFGNKEIAPRRVTVEASRATGTARQRPEPVSRPVLPATERMGPIADASASPMAAEPAQVLAKQPARRPALNLAMAQATTESREDGDPDVDNLFANI